MEKRNLTRAKRFKGHNTFSGIIRLVGLNNVKKSSRILDIGAGDGFIVRRLQKINSTAEVTGIDPDPQSDIIVAGAIEKIGFPENYFDLIICTDVIEHLPDTILNKGLKEISRVLSGNGIVCFSTLLKENLEEKTEMCPECGHIFHRVGHIQSFTQAELVSRLKESGLFIRKTRIMNLTLYSKYPIIYKIVICFSFLLPKEFVKLLKKDIVMICYR